MYPEPSLKADPEQRPGGMQNRGLQKIRMAAHSHYVRMQASPKENGYLLWLLKMQSMTMDEMMDERFESALKSMGPAWTEEGLINIYDEQKKTLIQDVMTQLKKLNYLQWEALIMVMGEKSFQTAGPIGAYGPFMNQINVQQAAYLFILAIGDLNNIEEKQGGSLDRLLLTF